ncbi:MAG: tetratricopeptide repeat protein [Aggregatilineales bacterium]
MGRFTRLFFERFRQFQQWERSAQIGFVLAIVLATVSAVVSRRVDELRTPATIGAMGALITAQFIFMWAHRGMITPFTLAQRHYLHGEFDQAIAILETLRSADEADFKAITLLGNTYRQVGDLDKSEAVLYEAVNIKPDHYFPLYGFGRTLLTKGCYAEAVTAFEQGLELGAPSATHFDLGEALYRAGQVDDAKRSLLLVIEIPEGEPHRVLMATYLLQQMGEPIKPSYAQIDAGLRYWEAQAVLFADTVYGQAVQRDITHLSLMREEI